MLQVCLLRDSSPAGLFPVTMVKILNEEGERNMRKPTGNYITLENCRIDAYDEVLYEDMAKEIARQLLFVIRELEKKKKIRKKKVIVAGLGNRDADRLTVMVEVCDSVFSDEIGKLDALKQKVAAGLKQALGISVEVKLVEPKTIQRSEGKAKRVIDNRNLV